MKLERKPYHSHQSAAKLRMGILSALLGMVCAIMLIIPNGLSACAMSALIAIGDGRLDQFEPVGPADQFYQYNDPWDYIGFVMANSTRGGNSDGYGVAAYPIGSHILSVDDVWYKRVQSTQDFGEMYYTGHHLEPDLPAGSWVPDVLDSALTRISNGSPSRRIVMCHARNATRPNLGNHPFRFNYRGRTYSFMHNGYCDVSRQFMIARIASLQPNTEWFSSFPSDYFSDPDPSNWVDSEVLFHYIMAHVITADGDMLVALNRALTGIKHYLDMPGGGVYNFILSDGERLYVFRSTPKTGAYSSYKLSWRSHPGGYHAIRTQYPSEGDTELEKQELVVFSESAKPTRYPEICTGYLDGSPAPDTIARFFPHGLVPVPILDSWPNPSPGTVSFRIRNAGTGQWSIKIYDIHGRKVWHTKTPIRSPGTNDPLWTGVDDHGLPVPNGIYLIKAVSGTGSITGKISLIRKDQ